MTKLVMCINLKRCTGCNTCTVACKMENNVPQGMLWNRVITEGAENPDGVMGTYPNIHRSVKPVACQHCENPACQKVCPTGATYKDDMGRVLVNYDKCIGCRMCMAACPYTGVRSFNWEEPAYYTGVAFGDADVPAHQKHTVEKCTMCWHRLAKGEKPFCIDICPERARIWGDLDDPKSEVSLLIAKRQHKTLLPEKGTRPSVYYLV